MLNYILAFTLGAMFGGAVGIATMAMLQVAGDSERQVDE